METTCRRHAIGIRCHGQVFILEMISLERYLPVLELTETAMQVSKWGDSLAVRLPKSLVDSIGTIAVGFLMTSAMRLIRRFP